MHRRVIREMHRHYENRAKCLGVKSPRAGSIAFTQRAGRVFHIDITRCPCGGELRAVAAICDPDEARRYLRHDGLPSDPPARAPPHYEPVVIEFDYGPAVNARTDQMPSPGWE